MSFVKRTLKAGADLLLGPIGYEIRSKPQSPPVKNLYELSVEEANKLGIDVYEYLEKHKGMTGTFKQVEPTVLPYLSEESVVCNLGPALGQVAQHVVPRLTKGELHLVDYAPWAVNYLKNRYRTNPRVHVHLNDGLHLPFQEESMDLVFSFGVFVAQSLFVLYGYSREFARVLRPGGHVAIEYFSTTSPTSWLFLEQECKKGQTSIFTYHAPETVDQVFSSAGFEKVKSCDQTYVNWPSTLLVVRKPANQSSRLESAASG
jgi:hypothetical protein